MAPNPSSPVTVGLPVSPGPAHSLVSGLVDEAVRYFGVRTPALIARVREHLLERAQAPSAGDGRFSQAHAQHLRGAALFLTHQESQFALAFTESLRECLHDEVASALPQAGFSAVHAGSVQTGLDGTRLSLIEVHEVNRILTLDRVCRRFDTFYEAQLLPLSRCMASLFALESASLTVNPFRPFFLLRAFMMAWERADFDSQTTEDLMLSLEPDKFIDLSALYDSLITLLSHAGVQPDGYRIRKSPDSRPPPTPDSVVLAQPGLQTASAVSSSAATSAREFLLKMTTGAAPQGAMDAERSPTLMAYLGEIQAYAAASDPSPCFSGQDIVGHNVLRHIATRPEIRLAPQADRVAVDAMAEIFDCLFTDQGVSEPMKAVIGRLQAPVLKAAMIDRKFFQSEEHPARKLLDTLAAASLAWTPERGEQDPLYGRIESAVNRVLTEFDDDLTPFSDSLLEFSEFLFESEQHAQKRVDLAASRELEAESLAHADQIVSTRVSETNTKASLAPFLTTFLTTQWRKVIAMEWQQVVARSTPDTSSRAQQIMDQLIWSTQPKVSPQERQRLVHLLPELLRDLDAGLDTLAWDNAERLAFMQRLMNIHKLVIRMNTTPHPATQARALDAPTRQTIMQQQHARVPVKPTQPEGDSAVTAQTLQLNMWFDLARPGLGRRRCKLSWVSPLRTRLLFTNRRGFEPLVCSEDEVVRMMQSGQILPLASGQTPLVSRAIQTLLAHNDTKMPLSA